MSSVEEGLLHDICEKPEDITPRLVYADWLDDRGKKGDAERAEFLRVQCRLDGEPLAPEEEARLRAREKALLDEWGKAWLKPFKGMFARHEYRRGFIERVTMKTKQFVEDWEVILSQTPLRFVKLRDPSEHIRELCWCKGVERLSGLSLNFGQMGAARTRQLLQSPHLGNLSWLDLGNNRIGIEGARALTVAGSRLGKLRFLALDDNNLKDGGVKELAAGPLLGQIEALDLQGNDLTDEALGYLEKSRYLGRLAQLHLDRNGAFTEEAIGGLLRSPSCPALRWVHLGYSQAMQNGRLKREFGQRVHLEQDSMLDKLERGPVAKL